MQPYQRMYRTPAKKKPPPTMSILSLSPEISLHIAGFLQTSDIDSLSAAIPPLSRLLSASYPWRNRWQSFKSSFSTLFWQIQDSQRGTYSQLYQNMYNNGLHRSQAAYEKSQLLEERLRERIKEMGFGDIQRLTPEAAFSGLHHVFNEGDRGLRMRSVTGDSEHISNVASKALEDALNKIAPVELVGKFIPEFKPKWSGLSRDYALLTAYLFYASLSPADVRYLRLGDMVFVDEPSLVEYFCFLGLFLRLYMLDSVLRPDMEPKSVTQGAVSFQAVVILEGKLDQYLEGFFAPSLHRPMFRPKFPRWKMVSSQGSPQGQLTLSSTVRSSSQSHSSSQQNQNTDVVTLTAEQQLIVDADIKKGELFKVRAYAGTGKTRCLVEYAAARPRVKMLYLAYNKSAQIDAEIRFKRCRNVTARTIHSLALGALKFTNKKVYRKLTAAREDFIERMHPERVVELLDLAKVAPSCYLKRPGEKWKEAYTLNVARMVMITLEKFCESSDEQPTEAQLPHKLMRAKGLKPSSILELARKAWSLIVAGKSDSISHDMYVKFMSLDDKGDHAMFSDYSVIMFDEAQDASSCQKDIILRQMVRSGILCVGDPYQQIYQFRGAKNECFDDEMHPPTRTFHLTTSFRFGLEIASVANCLLRNVREVVPVHGARRKEEDSEGIYRLSRNGVFPENAEGVGGDLQFAMIFRKNATMIRFVLQRATKDIKFFFKGNTMNHCSKVFPLLRDAYHLFHHRKRSRLKGLQGFSNWEEAKQYYDGHSDDADLQTDERVTALAIVLPLEAMIADLNNDFLNILDMCQRNVSSQEAYADIILSTVHQSKGLEYDNVVVGNDFDLSPDDAEAAAFGFHKRREVMNLLYVACTRARKRLFLSRAVMQFFAQERGVYRLFLSGKQDGVDCPVCRGVMRPPPSSPDVPFGRVPLPPPQTLIGYESVVPVAFEQNSDLLCDNAPTFPSQIPSGKHREIVSCVSCALTWKANDRDTDEEIVTFAEGVRNILTLPNNAKSTASSSTMVFIHNKVVYPDTLRTAMADCLGKYADRKCDGGSK